MTLHQLEIFECVARHLNLTKAARALRISEPTVFQQLKLLQEEFKTKLYKSIGRGIELTDRGIVFRERSRRILAEVKGLTESFNLHLTGDATPTLRIGGSHSLADSFLPKALAIFNRGHAGARATLVADRSRIIEKMVLNSELDLAVVGNPSYHPDLAYESCGKEKLVCFASAKNPLARKKEITLSELSSVPLVVRKTAEDSRVWLLLRRLEEQGVPVNVAMHFQSVEAVKTAVRTGWGLGLLYRELVEAEIKAGEFKVIGVRGLRLSAESFIIYPRERTLSRDAREFLAFLRKRKAE